MKKLLKHLKSQSKSIGTFDSTQQQPVVLTFCY